MSLPDACAKVVIADPPYGVSFHNGRSSGPAHLQRVLNDERPYIWWLGDEGRLVSKAGALVCFSRWDVEHEFRIAIAAAGLRVRSQVIWDRAVHGTGDCSRQFGPQHDTIWFAARRSFRFTVARPKSVIRVQRPRDGKLHPTEKPVALQFELLRCLVRPHDLIIDPFSGSGSAGVAAMRLGCRYIGAELELAHWRTATRRIAAAARGLNSG
jgi:DNA modification methylase